MLFSSTGHLIHRFVPGWEIADGEQLTTYAVFLVGIVCMYLLGVPCAPGHGCFVATTLLATQPVIFGYSFMNSKDIPFMTMFLATVVVGLGATNSSNAQDWAESVVNLRRPPSGRASEYHLVEPRIQLE